MACRCDCQSKTELVYCIQLRVTVKVSGGSMVCVGRQGHFQDGEKVLCHLMDPVPKH